MVLNQSEEQVCCILGLNLLTALAFPREEQRREKESERDQRDMRTLR